MWLCSSQTATSEDCPRSREKGSLGSISFKQLKSGCSVSQATYVLVSNNKHCSKVEANHREDVEQSSHKEQNKGERHIDDSSDCDATLQPDKSTDGLTDPFRQYNSRGGGGSYISLADSEPPRNQTNVNDLQSYGRNSKQRKSRSYVVIKNRKEAVQHLRKAISKGKKTLCLTKAMSEGGKRLFTLEVGSPDGLTNSMQQSNFTDSSGRIIPPYWEPLLNNDVVSDSQTYGGDERKSKIFISNGKGQGFLQRLTKAVREGKKRLHFCNAMREGKKRPSKSNVERRSQFTKEKPNHQGPKHFCNPFDELIQTVSAVVNDPFEVCSAGSSKSGYHSMMGRESNAGSTDVPDPFIDPFFVNSSSSSTRSLSSSQQCDEVIVFCSSSNKQKFVKDRIEVGSDQKLQDPFGSALGVRSRRSVYSFQKGTDAKKGSVNSPNDPSMTDEKSSLFLLAGASVFDGSFGITSPTSSTNNGDAFANGSNNKPGVLRQRPWKGNSANHIQLSVRGCLARGTRKMAHSCVIRIERLFRGTRVRDVVLERRCAIIIQRVFRGFMVREGGDKSATQMKCIGRSSLATEVPILKQSCAIRIQRVFRGSMARRMLKQVCAIHIQRVLRGAMVRQLVRKHFCATQIQRVFRGSIVRELVSEHVCATCIQKVIRSFLDRQRQRRNEEHVAELGCLELPWHEYAHPAHEFVPELWPFMAVFQPLFPEVEMWGASRHSHQRHLHRDHRES